MTVSIIGHDGDVQSALEELDTALSPFAIAGFLGATVSPYLRKRAADRFKSEGDDVSGPWQMLAESTVSIRESLGYGGEHPINKRTGELEAYITKGRHSLQVEPMGASLEMPGQPATGVLAKKVETAQRGSVRNIKGFADTPERPVLGMNERDLAAVMAQLFFYVKKAMR